MSKAVQALRIIAGGILFAIAIYVILAAPGFLSDSSSTVPINIAMEAGR